MDVDEHLSFLYTLLEVIEGDDEERDEDYDVHDTIDKILTLVSTEVEKITTNQQSLVDERFKEIMNNEIGEG